MEESDVSFAVRTQAIRQVVFVNQEQKRSKNISSRNT